MRVEEFEGLLLTIDYGCELPHQAQFEQFHQLFKQIRRLYFCENPTDMELHFLTTAFINSPFWDYSKEVVIDDMVDNFRVDQCLSQHLTRIADHYRETKTNFAAEKVILRQSLAALVDFGQDANFPYVGSLIPLLLIRTMRRSDFDITRFESEDNEKRATSLDASEVRRTVMRRLAYLGKEQRMRRIISEVEYRKLIDEVVELILTGELPIRIEPMRQQKRGTLLSGYSCEYVTYGISLLSYRYQHSRQLWIDYLSHKIQRSQSTLVKKFTRKPDSWNERIIAE